MKLPGEHELQLATCSELGRLAAALRRELEQRLHEILVAAGHVDTWRLRSRPGRVLAASFPPGGLAPWLVTLLDPHVPALLAVLETVAERFGREPGLGPGLVPASALEPPAQPWQVWPEAPEAARLVVVPTSFASEDYKLAGRFVEEGGRAGFSMGCQHSLGRLTLSLSPLGSSWSEEERGFAQEVAYYLNLGPEDEPQPAPKFPWPVS
ncbi:MAG TPA: hypothetical protein PK413_17550 [Thermoanaerobaculia bacterium]|nr:hypothetical protein [Thermoanaerobaculia bacterium]